MCRHGCVISLLSMLAYGVWGAVSSLASQNVSALTLQIVSTIGLFPVALVLRLFQEHWPRRQPLSGDSAGNGAPA